MREKSNFVKRIKAVVTFKFGAQRYFSFVFSENDVCFSAFRADEGRTRRHERGAECGGRVGAVR